MHCRCMIVAQEIKEIDISIPVQIKPTSAHMQSQALGFYFMSLKMCYSSSSLLLAHCTLLARIRQPHRAGENKSRHGEDRNRSRDARLPSLTEKTCKRDEGRCRRRPGGARLSLSSLKQRCACVQLRAKSHRAYLL